MKIKDFKCNYSDYTGIQKDFINTIDLAMPDMYLNGEDMAAYAIAIRKKEGRSYCKLPFDTAVEGEALGAVLKYDDSPLGLRKDADLMKQICDKIRTDIIAWFTEAKNHCDLLLYSDSSGGVNVIGPRMAKQLVEWFTI